MFFTILALLITLTSTSWAEKKPLEHDSYEIWNMINQRAISNDGGWVFLSFGPDEKDRELRIKRLSDNTVYQVERGQSAAFSADSRNVVALIKAFRDSVKQGKRNRLKAEKMPKDSLAIVTLETGDVTRIGRVKSFKMPKSSGGWLAYLKEKAVEPDSSAADSSATEEKEEEASETKEGEEEKKAEKPGEKEKKVEKPEEEEKEGDKKKLKRDTRKKAEGTELVLRNLSTGDERTFADVTTYVFSQVGNWLVFTTASKDSLSDALRAVELASGDSVTIMAGPGDFKQTIVDSTGTQVAFVANRDSFTAEQQSYRLYRWETRSERLQELASEGTEGVPPGWWVSEHGKLTFSPNGRRLYFGTAPRPAPDPEEETPDDERVDLDVWHWKDPLLQPQQLEDLVDERKRTCTAVVQLRDREVVQLGTIDIPDVRLGARGDADVALGITNVPYRQEISWDSPRFYDTFLLDVRTGENRLIATGIRDRANLSPEARYAYWWDRNKLSWQGYDVRRNRRLDLSAGIPQTLHYEDHDLPSKPRSHGIGGWTTDDRGLLINDRHDIWLVDPQGKSRPVNVTDGAGRADSLRFRYVRTNPNERSRNPRQPALLAVHDYKTKASGFSRAKLTESKPPEPLIVDDRRFTNPTRALEADRFLFTRSRFDESPDLYVSDPDFQEIRKVSDVNPQQKDYLWGTAELVEWRSLDGVPLQGILYKPEDFDPTKKYPMIVYFYERLSHIVHYYMRPRAIRSVIVPSVYTSRGYLVFMPDIRYKRGYPGESAVNCVIPGVTHLIDQGYVNEDKIGVQGQSWGGYQIAYMVTRSNIFAAAMAGAPVSNMTSAYGGIRWGSGRSRMMQYEKSQSRIGGSLWEKPARYIENSPVFWADKVQTPLLMMHNDQDGAVPWYQGIEMFVALRRLGKPVWMLNYNGDEHNLTKYQNRKDLTLRMQQYFDHYLMDAPAPVWLAKGIPAIEKGKTLGLELVD